MRLVNFRAGNKSEFGIEQTQYVYSLATIGYSSDLEFFRAGESALRAARQFLTGKHAKAIPVASVQLLSPVLRPGKILCVGLNYRDHAIESKMAIPDVPTIFSKYPTAVIGPGDPIVLPKLSSKPDY